MIKELSHLILAKSHEEVQLIVRAAEADGEIRLCVYPKLGEEKEKNKSEEEVNLLSKPVVLSGTPEELDECAWDLIAEHSGILAEGVDKVEGIQKDMDALVAKKKKEAEEARKKTKKQEESAPAQGDLFEDSGDRLKEEKKEPEKKEPVPADDYEGMLKDL